MEYYFQASVSSRYMVDGDTRVSPLVFEVIPTLLHVIVLHSYAECFYSTAPIGVAEHEISRSLLLVLDVDTSADRFLRCCVSKGCRNRKIFRMYTLFLQVCCS